MRVPASTFAAPTLAGKAIRNGSAGRAVAIVLPLGNLTLAALAGVRATEQPW
jgi:hypothetical protein